MPPPRHKLFFLNSTVPKYIMPGVEKHCKEAEETHIESQRTTDIFQVLRLCNVFTKQQRVLHCESIIRGVMPEPC